MSSFSATRRAEIRGIDFSETFLLRVGGRFAGFAWPASRSAPVRPDDVGARITHSPALPEVGYTLKGGRTWLAAGEPVPVVVVVTATLATGSGACVHVRPPLCCRRETETGAYEHTWWCTSTGDTCTRRTARAAGERGQGTCAYSVFIPRFSRSTRETIFLETSRRYE